MEGKLMKRPTSLRQSAAVALGVSMLAGPAMAQQEDVQLGTLKIEDRAADVSPYSQKGAPYKARISGDDRHTRPIAETPQTIAVLTQSQILESGYTDLKSILAAQPGITVGTGENGNAFGDRYVIRGQEAKSDVFVDGLRDPGMSIRESFAVEQIEISKGPNSSFAGRGTSGGAINAITKAASTDYTFGKASVGLGTDHYSRATADVNLRASDKFAVRGNLLYAYQDVPERAPADRERKGGAISALFAPSSALSVTVDYYGLRAKDKPDLGSYLSGDATTGTRLPTTNNVPSYVQKEDFLTSQVDTFTGRVRYEFTPDIYITNIARYGSTENAYVATGVTGVTTSSGNPTGVYATSKLDSGHNGWQKVRYVADQANLHVNTNLFGMRHELIFGGEYTNHMVDSGTYTNAGQAAYNCRVGAGAGALDAYCITDANGAAVANINNLAQRNWVRNPYASRKWRVENIAASVMDTVDITPDVTVFAGVRADHFRYALATYSATTGAASPFTGSTNNEARYSDTLWNFHGGLTYKIGKGMVYVSAASAADINGGESDTGTSSGYGGLVVYNGDAAGAKPERSVNLELGSKYNLFDDRLLVTASVFQIVKSGVMEGANYDTIGTFNSGKLRVRGVEFETAGNITDAWSVQGGVTWMQARVLASANSGLAAGVTNVGKTLANFANFQASAQTRYQLTEKLALGAAIKHKSGMYGGQPDTAAAFTQTATGYVYNQPVPAYTVGDVFAEYKFNNRMDLRVNVNNVTNTTYYTAAYRAGFFLYKGDARQATATLNVKF
jgi:catecholate siderophore receptor